jgi:DNA-binding GntR family transcriptional regulator
LSLAVPGPRDIQGEHEAIADAALARDADRACERLASHLRLPAQILVAAGFLHEMQGES